MSNSKKRNTTSLPDELYDHDDDLKNSDYSDVGEFQPGFQLIVEKILGRKFLTRNGDSAPEELFFIKWRNLSYFHVSWERKEDIERVDPQGKVKIKRFFLSPLPPEVLGTESGNTDDDDEIEYFQPDLVEVQRIIACNTISVSHAEMTLDGLEELADLDRESYNDEQLRDDEVKYLVKWRGLPYNECSWETWGDLKQHYREVWKFWNRQDPPSAKSSSKGRPSIQEYKRLEQSPKFFPADCDDPEAALTLRDYQVEGVNWLLWNWWQNRPCILADEMGLGKTIQSVCFLHQLRTMPSTKLSGPFLVVAPLSLLNQWHSEVTTWSSRMNCVVMHGNTEAREIIQKHEFYFQEPYVAKVTATALKKSHIYKFDIMLTTYEVVMKEGRMLSRIPWRVVIIDEAHRLKNPQTRVFQDLSSLQYDHCVLLTGTPLQNKTEELWSLLHFADKKKFNSQSTFVERFGDLRDAAHVAELHSVLKPYLLRRVKEDVEKSLPPKEETIIEVSLTPLQRQFYRAIYERNTAFLFKGSRPGNQPSLMNVMMELRKCCNHPYMIKGLEDRLMSELPPADCTDELVYKKLIDCSGKLVLLDKLLPRLYAEGHKVLIFSQMVRVLNILEDFLRYKNYSFERLDGSTRANERNTAVQKFCSNSLNRFVMLLSTKAGGLGLNLTTADTVIIFDSDWNPQNDIQAQARAHRIGQTRAVMVYRLLTSKTYEMHMFHRASLKLGLDRAVLAHARNEQDEEAGSGSAISGGVKSNLQAKEIEELLKRGAYDVFREDDSEQTDFVEADIDSIMTRRAHKVSYDNISSDKLSASLQGFSKASFISKDTNEDVDIDDPDFWQKAIGLTFDLGQKSNGNDFWPDETAEEVPLQRKRKAIQVYGQEGSGDDINQGDGSEGKRVDGKPAKETKDSKIWGQHTRDRLVKTLLTYGLGRLEKVKKVAGVMKFPSEEISSFINSFMFQCGICAVGDASEEVIAKEPECVKKEIRNAKALIESAMKIGESVHVPVLLQDEKFLQKLKQGVAKKNIQRLDIVCRAVSIVKKAVDNAFLDVKTPHQHIKSGDVDAAVAYLGFEAVAAKLPVPGRVPAWARAFHSWWDLQCSQHLVLGVFNHGFGNVPELIADTKLCFRSKINAWNADHGIEVVSSVGNARPNKDGDVVEGNEISSLSIHLAEGRTCQIMIKQVRESSFRGVYSQHGSTRWIALFGEAEGSVYIGTFDTVEQAAKAHDDALRELHGDPALCNFLPDGSRNPLVTPLEASVRPDCSARESRYDGVRPAGNMWSAQRMGVTGSRHLGVFSTELEAALAFDLSFVFEEHGSISSTHNFIAGFEEEVNRIFNESSPESLVGVSVRYFDKDGTLIQIRRLESAKLVEPGPLPVPEFVSGEEEEAEACLDAEAGGGIEEQEGEEGLAKEGSGEGEAQPDSNGPIAAAMPDVRFFNRMFVFLATYEPPTPKPRGPRKNAARATAVSVSKDKRDKDKTPAKSTEKSKRIPTVSEITLLGTLPEILDIEGIHLFHKKGGMKLCESLLQLKQTVAEIFSNVPVSTAEQGDIPSSSDGPIDMDISPPTVLVSSSVSSPQPIDTGTVIPALDIDAFPDALLRRICSGLLLYAAPLELQEDTELNRLSSKSWLKLKRYFERIGSASLSTAPIDMTTLDSNEMKSDFTTEENENDVRHSAIALQKYSWSAFCVHIGVDKSVADDLSDFYYMIWLPFCVEISSKSVVFNLHKRLLPNPYKKVSDHHLGARGLCHIFLRRQQLLHAMRHILQYNLDELIVYLQSPVARDVGGNLPMWWCPWIHDVGIMIGCLRHGYMALEEIVTDEELPFTTSAIERFVRHVFLSDASLKHNCSIPSGFFESAGDVDDWVKCMGLLFPDKEVLTARVTRMLLAFTSTLPSNHPCFVNIFHTLGLSESVGGSSGSDSIDYAGALVIDGLCITKEVLNSVKGIVMKRRRTVGPSDSLDTLGLVSDNQVSLPVMPLLSFLGVSAARRKSYCNSFQQSTDAQADH